MLPVVGRAVLLRVGRDREDGVGRSGADKTGAPRGWVAGRRCGYGVWSVSSSRTRKARSSAMGEKSSAGKKSDQFAAGPVLGPVGRPLHRALPGAEGDHAVEHAAVGVELVKALHHFKLGGPGLLVLVLRPGQAGQKPLLQGHDIAVGGGINQAAVFARLGRQLGKAIIQLRRLGLQKVQQRGAELGVQQHRGGVVQAQIHAALPVGAADIHVGPPLGGRAVCVGAPAAVIVVGLGCLRRLGCGGHHVRGLGAKGRLGGLRRVGRCPKRLLGRRLFRHGLTVDGKLRRCSFGHGGGFFQRIGGRGLASELWQRHRANAHQQDQTGRCKTELCAGVQPEALCRADEPRPALGGDAVHHALLQPLGGRLSQGLHARLQRLPGGQKPPAVGAGLQMRAKLRLLLGCILIV